MQTTNISWATYSWNPVTGCSHAGPECTHCYAETFSRRQGRTDKPWAPWNAEDNVTVHRDRLDEPFDYHWPEGHGRVFVCSMSDLFHELVPREFIHSVVSVAWNYPEHIWICLTKRPDRAASIDVEWPPNVWLGTSVGTGPGGEYPDTTHRLDQLREADAETLWVSFEPLIEPVGEVDLEAFDWVVVGGESAPAEARREMNHEWAANILRQARRDDAAYYFKQSSALYPEEGTRLTVHNEERGVYEQRRFREFPDLPEETVRARKEAIADA